MKNLIVTIICLMTCVFAYANIQVIETTKSVSGECTGTITINATGEAGPFTFSVVNNSGTQPTNATVQDVYGEFVLEGLCPGDYTITHVDQYGCEFTIDGTVEVEECEELEFTGTPNINHSSSCGNDGSFRWTTVNSQNDVIGGVGPYTYLWSNGQVGLPSYMTMLAPGEYTVTVTDSEGCQGTATFEIEGEGGADLYTESIDSCEGEDNGVVGVGVNNSPVGEWVYEWSTGEMSSGGFASFIENLSPGSYSVTVSDTESSCSIVYSAMVGVVPSDGEFQVNHNITQTICFGASDGTIIIEAEGGNPPYIYNWSNGVFGNIVDGLLPGIYNATVEDDCDREIVKTYLIRELDEIASNYEIIPGCDFDGSENQIILNPTGGEPPYSFNWNNSSNNSSSLIDLPFGTYLVTIEDSNGCYSEESINIQPMYAYDTQSQSVSCEGALDGSVEIEVVNSYGLNVQVLIDDFVLHESNDEEIRFTVQDLASGLYELVALREDGCQVEFKFVIGVTPPVKAVTNYSSPASPFQNFGTCEFELACPTGEFPPTTITEQAFGDIHGSLGNGDCEICVYCEDDEGYNLRNKLRFPKKRMRVGEYKALLDLAEPFFSNAYDIDWLKRELAIKDLNECQHIRVCTANLEITANVSILTGMTAKLCEGDNSSCTYYCCTGGLFAATDYFFCDSDLINSAPSIFPEGSTGSNQGGCERRTVNALQLVTWHNDIISFYADEYVQPANIFGLYYLIEEILNDPDKLIQAACADITFCTNTFQVVSENLDTACDPTIPPCTIHGNDGTETKDVYPCESFPYIFNAATYWCPTRSGDCLPTFNNLNIIRNEPFNGSFNFTDNDNDVIKRYFISDDDDKVLGSFSKIYLDNLVSPKLVYTKNGTNYMYDFNHYSNKVIEKIDKSLIQKVDNFDTNEVVGIYLSAENKQNIVFENDDIVWKKSLFSSGNLMVSEVSFEGNNILITGQVDSDLTIDGVKYDNLINKSVFIVQLSKQGEIIDFNLVENIDSDFEIKFSKNDNGHYRAFAGRYMDNFLKVNNKVVTLNNDTGLFVYSFDSQNKELKILDDMSTNSDILLKGIDISDNGESYALAFDNAYFIIGQNGYDFNNIEAKSLVLNFKDDVLLWEEQNESQIFDGNNVELNFITAKALAIGYTFSKQIHFFGEMMSSSGKQDIGILIVNENKEVERSETYGSIEDENLMSLLYNKKAKALYFSGEFGGYTSSRLIGKYEYVSLGLGTGKQVYLSFIELNEDKYSVADNSSTYFSDYKTINIDLKNRISIEPNPTKDEVNISIGKDNNLSTEVKIYSVSGVLLDNLNISEIEFRYDMSKLEKGVYIFRFKAGNEIVSKKVIKF